MNTDTNTQMTTATHINASTRDTFAAHFENAGFASLQPDDAAAIRNALRQLADSARSLDRLEQRLVRDQAVKKLQTLGVASPAKLIDAAFASAAPVDPMSQFLNEPDPWPDAVDGADLLNDTSSTFSGYLALPDHVADTLALWTAYSYVFSAFYFAPILSVCSPEKRCGKTTTFKILSGLCNRALLASNITPAGVFRIVDAYQPTLLIDEAETFLGEQNEALRGILNSGHSRSAAYVVRTTGDNHEPRAFSTFCPKAIAQISLPPATILDRSVVINMRRKTASDSVMPFREEQFRIHADPLRRRFARWASDNAPALQDSWPDLPSSLDDRARDNWGPLVAVADLVGGEWGERARAAAVALSASREESETSEPLMLLMDIREIFETAAIDRIASADLVGKLGDLEERPWGSYRFGRRLDQRQLSSILKAFGIRSRSIRFDRRPTAVKGYLREWFEDAFTRYVDNRPAQPEQAARSVLDSDAAYS